MFVIKSSVDILSAKDFQCEGGKLGVLFSVEVFIEPMGGLNLKANAFKGIQLLLWTVDYETTNMVNEETTHEIIRGLKRQGHTVCAMHIVAILGGGGLPAKVVQNVDEFRFLGHSECTMNGCAAMYKNKG